MTDNSIKLNEAKKAILKPKNPEDFRAQKTETSKAHDILFFSRSEEIESISIKGYDFNEKFDFNKFLKSYKSTGFQASNLAKAIEIIKKMRNEKAFIYLGYTSNMVSSGLREVIRYLAEHKMVDVIVATAGGIEEDFIKCLGDFKLGSFSADGAELREKGINRIGNIFVPNSRYVKFEKFVLDVLKDTMKSEISGAPKTQEVFERYKNEILTPSKLIKILGDKINNKESVYYWASKNNIPVFCPAIMDGSLGDMIYFFKSENKNFKLDITEDAVELNNSSLGKKKTGMIILGGGVIKHSICNANLYRNGADYAVYINSNPEFDGSDSGASPEEAKSWGKIASKGESVKVFGDATIIFPLIVAALINNQ
jgi:deoxyhypusine synthase